MTTMISEVYDALISAGADEMKARAAASAIANYDDRFNRLEKDIAIMKWMLGFVLAMQVAILWKVFS